MRSLRTWLALGLAAAIVAPAAAGLGAWVLAGDWQTTRETARVQDAIDVLSNSSIDDWDDGQPQALPVRRRGRAHGRQAG